jgi:hypothetical protein
MPHKEGNLLVDGSKNTWKYYLSSCFGYLYFTIYIFDNFHIYNILKENYVLFTPYIFPDTQKYLLHFECLAGQENGLIHTYQENILVIPTSSDLADSLKTCFVW